MAYILPITYKDDLTFDTINEAVPIFILESMGFKSENGPFTRLVAKRGSKIIAVVVYSHYAKNWAYDYRKYSGEDREVCETIGRSYHIGIMNFKYEQEKDNTYTMKDLIASVEKKIAIPDANSKVKISLPHCRSNHLISQYGGRTLDIHTMHNHGGSPFFHNTYTVTDSTGILLCDHYEEEPYLFTDKELDIA